MEPYYKRYKDALDALIDRGDRMHNDLIVKHLKNEGKPAKEIEEYAKNSLTFEQHYQRWYTEALAVLKQLLPERLNEFESHYLPDGKRKSLNTSTFRIQDWLKGIRSDEDYRGVKRFDDFGTTAMLFQNQLGILRASGVRFKSKLFEMKELLLADIFESELDAAVELNKKGFTRAAGALAGVVLEKHLSKVCTDRNLKFRKKHPTINDFNEALKTADIIDVPTWRFIQRLGDIRNLCTHKKDKEPTPDNVTELIDGTDKMLKTLY